MSIDNKTVVDIIVDDAGRSFREAVFDFVLINPPYVVTSQHELESSQSKKGF